MPLVPLEELLEDEDELLEDTDWFSEVAESAPAAVEPVEAVVEPDACLVGHAAAAEMADKARRTDWHFMMMIRECKFWGEKRRYGSEKNGQGKMRLLQ